MPRKRGGQPGNTNALKHGLYAGIFKKDELTALASVSSLDLTPEAELLRVAIRRTMEAIDREGENLAFSEQVACLRTLTLSLTCLSRLARSAGPVSTLRSQLDQALQEALQRIDPYETGGKNAS